MTLENTEDVGCCPAQHPSPRLVTTALLFPWGSHSPSLEGEPSLSQRWAWNGVITLVSPMKLILGLRVEIIGKGNIPFCCSRKPLEVLVVILPLGGEESKAERWRQTVPDHSSRALDTVMPDDLLLTISVKE